MITIIAAAAENNELGLNNQLVWHLPDDFGRFKRLTTGHCIVMGRKTFESFPKPLPNRTHIVITNNPDYHAEGIIVVHSLEEALEKAAHDPQPFVIGGGEIYAQSMDIAQRVELTRVHGSFDADTFFPDIPQEKWKLIEEHYHPKDSRHDHAFTYETWDRK
jgi:dihydrofolate reductase